MPCGASGKNKREEACCIDRCALNQYRHQSERPEKPPAADHAAGGFRTFQIEENPTQREGRVCAAVPAGTFRSATTAEGSGSWRGEKPRKGFLHN